MTAQPHTVLVVEDEPRVRARFEELISAHPELRCVGSAGALASGREALERHCPDVLLTDIGLPDGSGIELIAATHALERRVLPMVITVFGDEQHVVAALEAGALGYLLKDTPSEQVAPAIIELLAGGSPISPSIARYLLRRFRDPDERDAPLAPEAPQLSVRERDVLTYIVKGFTYGEAARLLEISEHTVATHVRKIYRKLAVTSRGEAVYEALQLGLVRIDE
jgi:DNA-binding NarL/FixJ family response regulator